MSRARLKGLKLMAIRGFRASISNEKNQKILYKYLPMRVDKENNIFFGTRDKADITDQKERKTK